MYDAADPFDGGGLEGAAPGFDGLASGGHAVDGGAHDAGTTPGMYCSRLNTCCSQLQQYGSSPSSVMSCQQTAMGGNESTCQFLLGTIQSTYLCFGI